MYQHCEIEFFGFYFIYRSWFGLFNIYFIYLFPICYIYFYLFISLICIANFFH